MNLTLLPVLLIQTVVFQRVLLGHFRYQGDVSDKIITCLEHPSVQPSNTLTQGKGQHVKMEVRGSEGIRSN
jgi:hypothetical protein